MARIIFFLILTMAVINNASVLRAIRDSSVMTAVGGVVQQNPGPINTPNASLLGGLLNKLPPVPL